LAGLVASSYITWRKFLGETPRLLKKLLEMGLAVQHTVHGRVAAHLQAANENNVHRQKKLFLFHSRVSVIITHRPKLSFLRE
jgi:hypothetical protein